MRDHRDLHGAGGGFGGRGGSLHIAQRAEQFEAHAGAVVEFGLQHAHAGHLLHGVEHHHGRRPAADLDQG